MGNRKLKGEVVMRVVISRGGLEVFSLEGWRRVWGSGGWVFLCCCVNCCYFVFLCSILA